MVFVFMVVLTCSTSDSITSNNNLTVFKNQTGDANADALQTQCKGSNNDYTLNIYGDFDSDTNPTAIKTVTYQKTDNDTIYNYAIDPITSRIKSTFYGVNVIKSNIVIKFDYETNQADNINVSFFDYNWQNQT